MHTHPDPEGENKRLISLLAMTSEELVACFQKLFSKSGYFSDALYKYFHKNGSTGIKELPQFKHNHSLALSIQDHIAPNPVHIADIRREGLLTKIAFQLHDGLLIEAVVVPMKHHTTLCISSQAGCRMGCRFCETGRLGFNRNLRTDEIVAQIHRVRFDLNQNISNIVFMGMGEPLDNFANVIQAIRVISDQKGLDIAHRHITLSTAGLVEGINKLAQLNWPSLKLAVSLNAPNDTLRSSLMPINKKISLMPLRQALQDYPLNKSGLFFIEYVLLKGINDSREHARELAAYLRPLKTRVNVIPCNPGSLSRYQTPETTDIDRFCTWLIQENLFVRTRTLKGQSILAGCGQLSGSLQQE